MEVLAAIGWALVLTLAATTTLALLHAHRATTRCRVLDQELRDRERLPATISHEIRTPLALVKGAAELLAEQTPGELNDVQVSFVETITENTQQVIDIAESFLTDLRLASTEPLTLAEVDVRAVVAEAAREMRRISAVPIHVDASGGVRPIHGDAGLIRQLVWNLVGNASRHTLGGGVVTVRVSDAEDEGALVTVIDQGEGMSDEDRERLFVPFVTGSSRRVGTGIGMSVAKRIVDAHGGRIMVDTSPGRGTMVHVLLRRNACSP